MQSKIDRSHEDSLCRFCKKADKSIDYNVYGCSKLNTEVRDKCYEHKAKNILENEDCNIVWDFSIHTYNVIEAWRSDLFVVASKNRTRNFNDFAVPEDSRISRRRSR